MSEADITTGRKTPVVWENMSFVLPMDINNESGVEETDDTTLS